MTLTENFHDAKSQLDGTFKQLEERIVLIDNLYNQLQRPHSCNLSRCGWGLAAFLATYLIFMYSWHNDSHGKIEGRIMVLETKFIQLSESLERLSQQGLHQSLKPSSKPSSQVERNSFNRIGCR